MSSSNQQRAADVARYFQAQYADFDEDLQFYRRLAQAAGGPILELGCGTGRILLPLASAGFAVIGVDHDLAMLNRLQAQLDPQTEAAARIIQAEIQQLPLTETIQLVLAPCSTLAFLDDQAFFQALTQIRRLLAPGGSLAIDLPAPAEELLDSEDNGVLEHFHEPERGTDIQLSAVESRQGTNLTQVDWHYDEMLPDGTIHRRTVTTKYHLRNLEQVSSLLNEAGLKYQDAYGDYQMGQYQPGSLGMIVIAGN